MAERFAARVSPLRQAGLIILGLGLTALCLWSTGMFTPLDPPRDPAGRWIGWFGTLFFGACLAIGVRGLFDRRELVVVDDRGILWRRWSDTTIPWREISNIDVRNVQRTRFLCLWLRRPEAYRATHLLGRLARGNAAMGFGNVAIHMAGLDRSFDDLADAVERHWGQAGG